MNRTPNAWRDSAVGKDLHRVRNVKPLWSKFGTIIGVALGGFDMWCNTLGFSLFGTANYSRLVGDFKRSPIVSQRGSANQWVLAAGLAQLPSATGKIASATRPCASRCTEIAAPASGASTRQKILPCSSSTQYCR